MLHVPPSDLSLTPLTDTLDRGVMLSAMAGMGVNALEGALAGVLLTLVAALAYALARNRIANSQAFAGLPDTLAHPVVDVQRFRLLCLWLGSVHIFQGLLGDLDATLPREQARRELRSSFWQLFWLRLRERLLILLWMERWLR